MKFIYPAVIHKNEDGTYTATFPDLEGCIASGDTVEEAVENANEAAVGWITVELEEDLPLPTISDIRDIRLSEGDIVRNICVNYRFYEGWDE